MKAQIRWAVLAAALAAPMIASAQQSSSTWTQSYGRTSIDTIVPLNSNGTVDLSLISGTIDVSSWGRDQVKIEATTQQGSLRFSASRSRVGLSVDQEGRGNRRSSGRTIYKVVVPRGARLIVKTVSGPITVKGVDGETKAGA